MVPRRQIDTVLHRLSPLKNWIRLDRVIDCAKESVPHPTQDEYGRGLHTFTKLDAITIRNMLFSTPEPRVIIWDTSPTAILMLQHRGVIWAIFSDPDKARVRTKRFKNAEVARRFVINKSKGCNVVSVNIVKAVE